jgi:hypothetical protein
MRLRYWIGLVSLGVVFAFIILLSLYQKPPVNWEPSFHKNETAPLGSKIIYELIKKGKDNGQFEEVNIPPNEFLKSREKKGCYLFYNSTIAWSDAAMDTLFEWVGRGNTVFISTSALPNTMLDTLAFRMESLEGELLDAAEILLQMQDNSYSKAAKYPFPAKLPLAYIALDTTMGYKILGEIKLVYTDDGKESMDYPHLIEIPMNNGRLFIHSIPVVFSNYFLLEESNLSYMEGLVGHLPGDQVIFHDNFYKDGRQVLQSPLSVFLGNRSLRMAYYCVLLIGLCWVIFEGKRKQRAIPILRENRNLSLDFSHTLAQLYASRNAYASMINHQLAYFKEFVSNRYQFQLDLEDQNTWERLSEKSGRPEETVRKELFQLSKIKQSLEVSEKELMQVNKIVTTYTHE